MLNSHCLYKAEAFKVEGLYSLHLEPIMPKEHKAALFFHGFPAWGSKNFDLAELLSMNGYHCFIIHYPGLGLSDGVFDFFESIQVSKEWICKIQNKYNFDSISCVGHSWGGFVLSQLVSMISGKSLFLAPLILEPDSTIMDGIIEGLIHQYPIDSRKYTAQSMKEAFKECFFKMDIEDFRLGTKNNPSLVVHGMNDLVIPLSLSQQLIDENPHMKLRIIDDDHSLIGKRREVFTITREWFL
jgi:pimeloyl-ACP methyl ester carboxylesterase